MNSGFPLGAGSMHSRKGASKSCAYAAGRVEALGVQFRELRSVILATYLPALSAIGALAIISFVTDIEASYFTRDPTEVMKAPFYVGLFSNIGVLGWWAGAVVCLFGAALLYRATGAGEWALFLFCSGLLTAWLALDDFFTLHDVVIPTFLYVPDVWPLSMPQKLAYAALGAAVLVYLVRFRSTILRTNYLLLVLAFGFLGLSVFFDGIQGRVAVAGHPYFEDGAKLMGISGWVVYQARTAMQQIGRLINERTKPDGAL